MPPRENRSTSNDSARLDVKANAGFTQRRFITLPGLTIKEFRQLKAGRKVSLKRTIYEKYKIVLDEITKEKE